MQVCFFERDTRPHSESVLLSTAYAGQTSEVLMHEAQKYVYRLHSMHCIMHEIERKQLQQKADELN